MTLIFNGHGTKLLRNARMCHVNLVVILFTSFETEQCLCRQIPCALTSVCSSDWTECDCCARQSPSSVRLTVHRAILWRFVLRSDSRTDSIGSTECLRRRCREQMPILTLTAVRYFPPFCLVYVLTFTVSCAMCLRIPLLTVV